MVDLINRAALGIGKCDRNVFENKAYADGWNSAISVIESAPVDAAVDKLAAYENTGLSPAEIEQMKADNVRLHKLLDNIECVMRGEI